MIRLEEMKIYIKIVAEKNLKYLRYYHVKLLNMNILQVNKFYLLIRVK